MSKKSELKKTLFLLFVAAPIFSRLLFGEEAFASIPQYVRLINPAGFTSFPQLLCIIAKFIFTLSVPVAILMILYSGFMFLTAAGSPERIRAGKNALVYAVVGIIVAIAAQGMVLVISNFVLKSGSANVCSGTILPSPATCSTAS